ncbi:tetratricopeptide repeat protein [Anabaena sp. CCY 0017]|uniref:tetratricopeptide repeat protein n=1 Tax=Anabaena sp. CCY 0017 TaxID=3103866 RepID=UPI0039C70B4B
MELIERSTKAESPGILKAGDSPKSLAYWQGRTEEIAQIQQWLTDENTFLIGIEGIGGTGKSTLSAKIYDEIGGFPKRFWADVGNGASFSDLARKVLQEFGFPVPEQETQLVEALIRCLRTGQFLLIIDNLESLLQADRQWGSLFYGDFFNAWVESGSKSKVLVTTRERPELPKGFAWLTLKGLQVEEGVALLTALGIRGDLAEFVKLVDGHPLLLRLVADLLKEEYSQDPDLSRLADLGLGNLQQLLTDPQVVGVHRRENVGMVLVLDASFARLSELQKALLLNISVYRGAISSAAALAVLPESSEAEIEQELRNLVKRSLLVEKLNGKRRFEFQPVVLEYVRYKAGNQTEAHQRAIDYYRSIAKQPPWTTKEDVKEYLEIFDHFYQLEDYNSAFDSIRVCDDFLSLRGYYIDQVELYGQLVNKWQEIGDHDNWKYRDSLIFLGNAYYFLGDYQKMIEFNQQSLEISLEIGDYNAESEALNGLGVAHNSLGQYQQAINFLQKSLEIKREIGDRYGEGTALVNLGYTHNSLGQYQQAINFFQKSLEIKREIGDRYGEGICLGNLGNFFNSLRQYQRAIDFYQQSLAIASEIGDRYGEGNYLMGLGNTYNSLGQYQLAINFFQQSLEIKRQIGNRSGEGNALNNLGNAYNCLGQYQRAIYLYQQSLDIAREIGDGSGESNALNNLGNAYRYCGKYQEAIDFHQQSFDIATEIGDRNGEGISLGNLGNAFNSLGQYQQAINFYQQSLDIAIEIGDRPGEGICLGNLGNTYNSLEQYEQAINFLQKSLAIKRQIGDRNGESDSLINLGNAYDSLEEYQRAIEFYQQSLDISREIGDIRGEANAWFNLGLTLKNVNRESDALGAYRNARELFQTMGIDTNLQNCNDAIERLSQPQTPVVFRRGSWSWLWRFWRWVRSWFRR